MISGSWPAGRKELALTVNGAPVAEEVRTLTYTDDLNGDSAAVMLGSTAAAQLVLVIDGPGVNYAGARLAVSLGGVPLGVFDVVKTERRGSLLTVTAMDAMAGEKLLLSYTPGGASSALGVIREIAAAAGLAMADTGGIADVAVTPAKGLTRRDMLGRMAALLGKNAHIDRYGKLALKWYGITDFAVTADDYYADGLSMAEEDFALERLECSVTTTTTQTETDESGNTTTSEVVETAVLTAGSGMTGISIANEYMTQTALDAVYAAVGGVSWRPMQLAVYGDARVESGDMIAVTDDAGETHRVPVMRVEHIWDGGVKTTVTAVGDPSEGLGSGGGTLSKAVDNLALEFARFKNLEAENLRAQNAKFERLEAADISADRLTTGKIQSRDGSSYWDLDSGELVLSAYATQEELDGLNIGGRNRLLNTGTEQSIPGGSGWRRAAYYLSAYGALQSGGVYTLTVCFTPGAGLTSLQLNNSKGYIFTTPYDIAVDGSGRQTASVTLTATKDESDHISLYAIPTDGTNTGATTIHWIKLESGSKATDWTAAPEDTQSEIDALNDLTTTENGATVIDGAKIKTGSVTAGRITVTDADGNVIFEADANNKKAFLKADQLTAGKIQSRDGSSYWDLDSGELVLSAYATQEELDGLNIGGRNRLLNTGTEQSIPGGSGWRRAAYYLSAYGALQSGGVYTLTVCFTPGAGLTSLQLNNSEGYIFTTPYSIAVDGSGRQTASMTFTATKDESDHIRLYAVPNDGTNTGATTIHWIKLESGSKETDWTAAPEDTQSEIDTLNDLTTTENGTTVIDGAKIKTGSVTAGRITVTDAAGNTVFDADANNKKAFLKADQITAGTLRSKDGSSYWNLDSGELVLNAYATQEELDGLTIGGRNRLLNTGTEQSIPGGSGWRRAAYYLSAYGALQSGGVYTLTVCFTPGAGLTSLQLNNSAGLIFTTPYSIAVDGSGRQTASVTLTATKDESDHIRLYAVPTDGTNTGATTIHWIKLESGSKATDWTPAPEDTQSEIDALNDLTTTENGTTVIDGAKIKTGSITAGRITVRDAAGNTVFDADANGKTVQIGGFAVDADKLVGEKISISGSEITLTGPASDAFEQSAHIADANIVWYANDGSGFGARGHIGTAEGFPTFHPDPDGYLHINALYKGNGIRFGYDGGIPEKLFDMDVYGLEAYKPIYLYNEDGSSYVPVNFNYAKAWYYLVKQAEGDPGPDTAPVSGSARAITSGAMYPASVTGNITLDDVTGVTVAELYAYTVGKMAWVRGQITLSSGGVYTSWKNIAAGLPKPVANVYDQLPSRGTTYYRPLDVSVNPAGNLRIRYGANTGGWLYFVNICYPIS